MTMGGMPALPQGYSWGGPAGVTQHTLGRRIPMSGGQRVGLGGSMPGARSQGPGMNQGFGQQMSGADPWARGLRSPHNSQSTSQPAALQVPAGGVRPGNNMMGGPSVGAPGMGGPSIDQIQAEMKRRQVGAQLGPRNGALAGYMMG